jgi:hypothetical protein
VRAGSQQAVTAGDVDLSMKGSLMALAMKRSLAVLTTAGTAAGLLLGAGATSASAATTFGHLSTSSVLSALPGASSLPTGVKLLGKVEVAPAKPATPCGTASPAVSLANASEVAAVYTDGKTAKPSATTSVWAVDAAVFATPKQAVTAATALAKVEAGCPAQVTQDGATLTRTVAALDTAQKGLWKGFRQISHLTDSKSPVSVRVWNTWFTRGNVLLEVTEEAPVTTPAAQTTQDTLRKAFILATLAKLDTAAS